MGALKDILAPSIPCVPREGMGSDPDKGAVHTVPNPQPSQLVSFLQTLFAHCFDAMQLFSPRTSLLEVLLANLAKNAYVTLHIVLLECSKEYSITKSVVSVLPIICFASRARYSS